MYVNPVWGHGNSWDIPINNGPIFGTSNEKGRGFSSFSSQWIGFWEVPNLFGVKIQAATDSNQEILELYCWTLRKKTDFADLRVMILSII